MSGKKGSIAGAKERLHKFRKKISQENSLNRLLALLFVLFLVVTVAYISYIIVVPTPTEWEIVTRQVQKNSNGTYVAVPNATSFPNDVTWGNVTETVLKAVLRHLAVFPEHISQSFLITTINFAFLTMFIWHIGEDVRREKEEVEMSVYVEWAMGSLVSGILFFSSSIIVADLTLAFTTIAVIVVFALVLYFLYTLRCKLKKDEEDEAKKREEKLKEDAEKKKGKT